MHDRGEVMTEDERLELVNWVCANFYNLYEVSKQTPRLIDYRLSPLDKNIPIVVWKIKKRIIDREGLKNYIKEPFLEDILTLILPGGGLHNHRDPNLGNFIHTRFNVFIQLPKKNMKVYYAHDTIDAKERHYTMCRSGLDTHGINLIKENKARITLSFGYLIPRERVDKMYSYERPPLTNESNIMEQPSEMDIANYMLINSFVYGTHGIFKERYGMPLKDVYNIARENDINKR